ncbi:unnamed protein product, partial [Discosporangium mesarthrocarpum]
MSLFPILEASEDEDDTIEGQKTSEQPKEISSEWLKVGRSYTLPGESREAEKRLPNRGDPSRPYVARDGDSAQEKTTRRSKRPTAADFFDLPVSEAGGNTESRRVDEGQAEDGEKRRGNRRGSRAQKKAKEHGRKKEYEHGRKRKRNSHSYSDSGEDSNSDLGGKRKAKRKQDRKRNLKENKVRGRDRERGSNRKSSKKSGRQSHNESPSSNSDHSIRTSDISSTSDSDEARNRRLRRSRRKSDSGKESDAFFLDRRGDKNNLAFGGFYRLDIPIYHGIGRSSRGSGTQQDVKVSRTLRYFGPATRMSNDDRRLSRVQLWKSRKRRDQALLREVDTQSMGGERMDGGAHGENSPSLAAKPLGAGMVR